MSEQNELLTEIRELLRVQGERSQEMLEMYRRQFEGELKSRAAYERTLEESVTAYKKALQKRDLGGRILSGALALVLIAFGYLLATWR